MVPTKTTQHTDPLLRFTFSGALRELVGNGNFAREQIDKARMAVAVEPGAMVTGFTCQERNAVENARGFLSQLYLERGLPRPLQNPSVVLSGLRSRTGYAGLAHPLANIAIRYPGAPEEGSPLKRTALWVHELTHLASTRASLTRQSGVNHHLEHALPRSIALQSHGWMIVDNRRGLTLFRALEEFVACCNEEEFLVQNEARVRDSFTELRLSETTPANDLFPVAYFLASNPALLSLRGQMNTDSIREQVSDTGYPTLGFGRILELPDGSFHENVYGQLLPLLDLLALEVYPNLPQRAAREKFRRGAQEVHAGAPFQPFLSDLKSAIGPEGVRFIARIGAVHNSELYHNSPSMVLLTLFVTAVDQPAEYRVGMRRLLLEALNAWEIEQRERLGTPPTAEQITAAVNQVCKYLRQQDTHGAVLHYELSRLRPDRLSPEQCRQLVAAAGGDELTIELMVHHRCLLPAQVR